MTMTTATVSPDSVYKVGRIFHRWGGGGGVGFFLGGGGWRVQKLKAGSTQKWHWPF